MSLLPQGPNPYTTLSSELIHERPYVRFFKNRVRIRGLEKDYSYIEVDNSVGVVAVNERAEVALVGQWRYPVKGYRWEIPAGMCESGEDLLETAQRELLEETGVKARKWTPLGSYQMEASKMDQRSTVFLAEDLEIGKSTPMEDEKITVKWLPFKEALLLVEKGEIDEALSVIGLTRAEAFLRKKG